jgi:YHS domain-containing protein
MPPLGPLFGQRVYVDKNVAAHPEVTFNGGSHRDAIRMSFRELERLSHPAVADFSSAAASSVQGQTRPLRIDPICGAVLDEHQIAVRSDHRGETYYFCSLSCKMEFDDNPDAYADA